MAAVQPDLSSLKMPRRRPVILFPVRLRSLEHLSLQEFAKGVMEMHKLASLRQYAFS